ncbi:MAG: hypothetical protein NTW21_35765, partial [Verrucomicrobia bacterium]|nr:hypothetical protein [Verrucomicrobiota bacterium]
SIYKLVFFGDLGNASGASNVDNGAAGVRDSEGDWNWDSVITDASGTILGTFTAPNPTLGLYGAQLEFVSAASGYSAWAAANAGGQTADQDYNNDGVANGIAYFMGMTGLATLPGVADGKVTWPRDPTVVASFIVQVSDNLSTWTDFVPPHASINETVPTQVTYTLPSGATRQFCRLVVTP